MKKILISLIVIGVLVGGYFLLRKNRSTSFDFSSSQPNKNQGTTSTQNAFVAGLSTIRSSEFIQNSEKLIEKGVQGGAKIISDSKDYLTNTVKNLVAKQIDTASDSVKNMVGVNSSNSTTTTAVTTNINAEIDNLIATSIYKEQSISFIVSNTQLAKKFGSGSVSYSLNWGDGTKENNQTNDSKQTVLTHKYTASGTFTAKFVFSKNNQSLEIEEIIIVNQ